MKMVCNLQDVSFIFRWRYSESRRYVCSGLDTCRCSSFISSYSDWWSC